MQNFFRTGTAAVIIHLGTEVSSVLDVTFTSGWAEILLGRSVWLQKYYVEE